MCAWLRAHGSVALLSVLVVACGQPADTGRPSTEDLVLSLAVEPETLYAADTLVATLGVLNPTPDTIDVETAGGCLGVVGIADWIGTQRAFTGLGDPCPPASRKVVSIPPGESVSRQWEVVAWLHSSDGGSDSTLPWPGRYALRLETPPSLPDTEAFFVVLPSGYYMGWRRCGFTSPSAADSIVVAVDSAHLAPAALLIWYRVRNLTSQEIRLMEGGAMGGIANGVTVLPGQGWLAIESIVERQTTSGWEAVTAPRHVESYPIALGPTECLQAVTGSSSEAGTYRLRVLLQPTDSAYSESFVVN